MDKGAHFFKCDFQVHTPRDINWSGKGAVSHEERGEYADELIAACRSKGLNAIAITDHHDLTFFPYIKGAAVAERDENNDPVPPEKQIVVFPGMELTLSSPPCQAILILDSDFPLTLLSTLYNTLVISRSAATAEKNAEVQRLQCIQSFEELYKLLNQHDYLEDKFIILPNISESTNSTLLRSGFHDFYKRMPCVGGYLDGSFEQLGNGNIRILDGKDRNYGPKSLGIFQTSDNRQRDHESLGSYATWVKWTTPTAEALRQACLAKESRISQIDPSLPSIYIISMDVSNSMFMGPITLEFNQQYNALIGGRGTGKSTILEYLRWGLCDQPPELVKGEELPEYQVRRKRMVEKTLLPYDSTVQISFMKNNVSHIIRRKSTSSNILLKIADGEFTPCKQSDVRNLLPVQAYSQKQLSSVGVSVEELKRLIHSPIRQVLDEFKTRTKELSSEIRNCYELMQRKRMVQREVEKDELELKSLSEQVGTLRKGLRGISDKDREIISIHEKYEEADQLVQSWQSELEAVRDALMDMKKRITGYPTSITEDDELPKTDSRIIFDLVSKTKDIFSSIGTSLDQIENILGKEHKQIIEFAELVAKWSTAMDGHKKKYDSAKQKSSSHEVTIKQIQQIENRIKEIRKYLLAKKQSILKTGDPEERFSTLRTNWFNLHRERGNLLEEQCMKLSDLSSKILRATLERGKGTDDLEQRLKDTLFGAKVRGDKIDKLCTLVAESSDPVQEWNEILKELELLAIIEADQETKTALPSTPLLTNSGFTVNEIRRMTQKLTSENWIELFLVELDDLPFFEYQTRDGEYIHFSDASAGQQATALMYVLLHQEGPPLIIDQPEEDLDNQMVSDIARLIWSAKKRRQLVFASHNANMVVNGDSEIVVCCNYKVVGDQSKGEIEKQGAIDVETIKNEITKVMEGGEEAFKLRKEKYGF